VLYCTHLATALQSNSALQTLCRPFPLRLLDMLSMFPVVGECLLQVPFDFGKEYEALSRVMKDEFGMNAKLRDLNSPLPSCGASITPL
jgi:hypothetical protein